MKISVITINLNNRSGLELTFKSVFKQSYADLEYLVIDGGSEDGSEELIKSYQEKINYWISEKDSGIYEAMNKGIALAKGDFLLFLNSGDTLSQPTSIAEAVEQMKHRAANIYYSDVNLIEPKHKTAWVKHYPAKINEKFLLESALCHQSMLIEKKLFDKIGLYKENYQLSGDWVFSFDAYMKGIEFKKIEQIVLSNFILNGFSSDYRLIQKERTHFLHECYPQYLEQYKMIIKKKGIFTRMLLKTSRLIAKIHNSHKKNDYLRYISSVS